MASRQLVEYGVAGVFLAVLLGVIGWQVYQAPLGETTAQAQASVRDYQAQIQEIDAGIQRFQALELDVAFLSSPGFRNLKDYSVALPRAAVIGRDNPFEPLPEIDPEEFSLLPERAEEGEGFEDSDFSEFDSSIIDDFFSDL